MDKSWPLGPWAKLQIYPVAYDNIQMSCSIPTLTIPCMLALSSQVSVRWSNLLGGYGLAEYHKYN